MTDWAHYKMAMWRTFEGKEPEATKVLYTRLEALGPVGAIAVNLLRAAKTSSRAKVYRGPGSRAWRRESYDRKGWSIGNLCRLLAEHAPTAGIAAWGWGRDEEQPVYRDVFYVELPTGQVSFHSEKRLDGPDYPAAWDGVEGKGGDRIISWCAPLLWRHETGGTPPAQYAVLDAALERDRRDLFRRAGIDPVDLEWEAKP